MDKIYNDSILWEMRKNKLEWSTFRLTLANYSNLFIWLVHFLLECYFHGFYNQVQSKLTTAFIYATSLGLITLSKKNPLNTAIFSFIHGEILILYLMYSSFFSESNAGVPYAFLTILVLIFFQSYLILNITLIIFFAVKFIAELLFFAYFSGYFLQGVNENSVICLISTPIYLGLCMYFDYLQDVQVFNAKRQAETTMDKIEYIVGAIPDGIAVVNESLKTVFNNARMNDITLGSDTLIYLSELQYHSKLEKTQSKLILDDIKQAFNDEFGSELNFGITKKNEKLIEWKGKVIRWDLKPCIILYARDMTRIMTLEKESNENKYKSLLLRTVSHELRTPTNAMMAVAEMVKDSEELSKENQDRVNIIYCSCSYLLCLINDLLDYSQMVAGCLKIVIVQFDLHKLVEECVKLIKIQIRNRPIKVKTKISPSVPSSVSTDPNRLKQILLNLLGNSLKFTITGTIRLEISFSDSKLYFSIYDTGIGIPKSKLSLLFKQFGKIEQSTLNPQGAGLGLFISNMLTFRLGGKGIKVTSEEEIGSCFNFEITLSELNRGLSNPYNEKITAVNYLISDKDNSCILIVDDTYFNVLALQQVLDKEGFKSESAISGEEAIEKVRKKTYDLILMDCEMPNLNGWETTQILKEMGKAGGVPIPPIIGNTSHSYENLMEKCLSVGMDDVIAKPCPREDLIKTVSKWLALSKVKSS